MCIYIFSFSLKKKKKIWDPFKNVTLRSRGFIPDPHFVFRTPFFFGKLEKQWGESRLSLHFHIIDECGERNLTVGEFAGWTAVGLFYEMKKNHKKKKITFLALKAESRAQGSVSPVESLWNWLPQRERNAATQRSKGQVRGRNNQRSMTVSWGTPNGCQRPTEHGTRGSNWRRPKVRHRKKKTNEERNSIQI